MDSSIGTGGLGWVCKVGMNEYYFFLFPLRNLITFLHEEFRLPIVLLINQVGEESEALF